MAQQNKKSLFALICLLGLCLLVPVVSMFIDFGGGTDDAAGAVVKQITGEAQVLEVPSFGYEPSEVTEPWLFLFQTAIGIVIFILALCMFKKESEDKNV